MFCKPIRNPRKNMAGPAMRAYSSCSLPPASSRITLRMVVSPGLLTHASGLFQLAHLEISSHRIQKLNSFKFPGDSAISISSKSFNGRVSYKHVVGCRKVSVGLARQSPSFHDEEPPLWLSLVRDIVWSTRDLFSFMAEQPSQLKFIEWPSFITTLKTATLSLFLVAVFIVALSSVDSSLCYVLALILRKAP